MADSNKTKHINIKISHQILANLEISFNYNSDKTYVNYSQKNYISTNIDDILKNSEANNNPTSRQLKTLLFVIVVLAIAIGFLTFFILGYKN